MYNKFDVIKLSFPFVLLTFFYYAYTIAFGLGFVWIKALSCFELKPYLALKKALEIHSSTHFKPDFCKWLTSVPLLLKYFYIITFLSGKKMFIHMNCHCNHLVEIMVGLYNVAFRFCNTYSSGLFSSIL